MTRSLSTLTRELADTQAKLQRLLAREAELEAVLADAAPAPTPRPGWPIRRLPPQDVASLH